MNLRKTVFLPSMLLLGAILTFSCHKITSPNNSNPGNSATALWPLGYGNVWYYNDSSFSDTSAVITTPTAHYLDTISVITQGENSGGLYFYGLNNPNGWFGTGSYIAVDPTNTSVYEWDSLSGEPYYTFFETASQDGTYLGSGTDYTTNPACPITSTQYGFASTTTIGAYTCQANIIYTVNCNNVTIETTAYYLAPGVGPVRIEDYALDTATNQMYLDYSQTLTSYNLAK
jgi:hypothetical protein